MNDKPHDLTDSQRNLAAIVEHAAEEGTSQAIMLARKQEREEEHRHTGYTPAPVSESSETIRGISERVFDERIKGHRLSCMEPGGGLRELGNKVDKILEVMSAQQGAGKVWKLVGAGAWAVALAVLGFTLNHFAAQRNRDTAQMQAARDEMVTKKLAKVEEVAKALLPLESFTPAKGGK